MRTLNSYEKFSCLALFKYKKNFMVVGSEPKKCG
jgi:hypothetical protein